jgi:diaminohydroxyphosphoribosylaminopyrimidine deaminase / 5-amino-6-(5-phosphoribosylamino)uracil reductase
MTDEQWMKRVLRLARKGQGRTAPNPMVGAILVKNGKIVGQGYHARAGEAHAEVIALERAGKEARGATLYLNLEPCTHFGRTPPCAPRVIASGIKRAVIGMKDPNPVVQGKGIAGLIKAGIEVESGVLEKACRTLNEAFSKYILKGTPFIILKAAATLDGKTATRTGDSKWISGEESRRRVHQLRNQVDGIVVGIDTVREDNPLLTARVRGGRDPLRIVLDSRLRVREDARIMEGDPSRVILATTKVAPRAKVKRLEERGARVLILPAKEGRVDLQSLAARLGTMGIMSLMVEGGSRVNGAFLDAGLIDKVVLFVAPKLIGDAQAPGIFGGKGVATIEEAMALKDMKLSRVGEDIVIEGYL